MNLEREQFLADVITTAIEGGTGYWAEVRIYKWDGLSPGEVHAVIEEFEEPREGTTPMTIDIDVIAKGIGLILKKQVGVRADLGAAISVANKDNDAGMIDADAADVIVQAALFGKVVYG